MTKGTVVLIVFKLTKLFMNTLFSISTLRNLAVVCLFSALSGLFVFPAVQAQSRVYAQNFSAQKPAPLYKVPDMKVAIYQLDNTTRFKVHFENASGGPVIIRLKNAANKIIHQEEVSEKKYIRRFDLATLEDGNYTFEISSTKEIYTKEIQLQTLSARTLHIVE
jgi:hypothetical protein